MFLNDECILYHKDKIICIIYKKIDFLFILNKFFF